MRKNMFKVMALSLAMAALSTTAAFAAGWGKVGSEWYYYQEDGNVARNTWINTLVSNDESGELSYQVGSKDFVTEEGKMPLRLPTGYRAMVLWQPAAG